jgi:hypothetical protein
VGGSGGKVSGLAIAITFGFVGGSGGKVSGLAIAVTFGRVGGSGGKVSGLAIAVTFGFVGGSGGKVSGLAIAVTFGFVGGSGGNVSGLTITETASAATAATKTKFLIFNDLEVMILHSLLEKEPRMRRVTRKCHFCYYKSNIAGKIFCDRAPNPSFRGMRRHIFVLYSPIFE